MKEFLRYKECPIIPINGIAGIKKVDNHPFYIILYTMSFHKGYSTIFGWEFKNKDERDLIYSKVLDIISVNLDE